MLDEMAEYQEVHNMARVIGIVMLVVAISGCATSAPTVYDAYIWPVKGQGSERTAQDKAECYRVSQGFADGVTPTASAATGLAFALGGLAQGAAAHELELARRYPPDLSTYGACLTARGYSVDWPQGKQP
jgi:hypothetical protein